MSTGNGDPIERLVSHWLAGEAPAEAPDRLLMEVRARIDRPRFAPLASHVSRFAMAAVGVAALAILALAILTYLRLPVQVAPGPTSPTSTPSAGSPSPAATIDATDRLPELVLASPPANDTTYLLAGEYALVLDAHADKLCSVVIVAANAAFPLDAQAPYGRSVDLLAFTGSAQSSIHGLRVVNFPRGHYRLLVGAYDPLSPPQGDGTAVLCSDWSIRLVALTQAATTTKDTTAGNVRLDIAADGTTYRPNDLITAGATLTYSGAAERIRVVGSGSGLVGFGVQQLDGDLGTGPFRTDDCRSYELVSGQPLDVSFIKSGGYAYEDPNADFYRSYFATRRELRLPAGVWRITAYANMTLDHCGGNKVDLDSSITVVVAD